MPKGQPGTLTHGISAYANRRCTCDVCHGAYTAWRRARYGQRPREVVDAEREAPHGTESRYARCRCDACRTAANAARTTRRHTHPVSATAVHGKATTYKNGCRCDECRLAHNVHTRERRARLRVAA